MSKSAKILPIHREESSRLKALFKERCSKSQADFGADTGIGSQGMVWQYLNARAPLNLDAAIKFAKGLKVSVSQFSPRLADLLPQDLPPSDHVRPFSESAAIRELAHESKVDYRGISLSANGLYVDPVTHSSMLDEGTITVPVISLAQRSGESAQIPDGIVIDNINLGRTWVHRNLPKISHTDNLVVATHYDDSMSGTFEDGDLVLIDRGVTSYQTPAVYVIQVGEDVDIRRVQRMPDKKLLVKPDNDVYQPATVDEGAVQFLGRVVWAWKGSKM